MTLSGRGLMPGADVPHSLESLLPGVYLEPVDPKDGRGSAEFVRSFCAGLDCVMAPALVTLDCLEAYFDPRLTPSDFLEWLAGWVGLSLDQNWPEQQQRSLVLEASELYRWQGTARGIIEHIRLSTGFVPEVHDSGGVTWSTTPDSALPGDEVAELRVQLTIGADDDLDLGRLDATISRVKPAHMVHTVNIVRRARPQESPALPPAQLDGREAASRPPLNGRRRSGDILTYAELRQHPTIVISCARAGRPVASLVVSGDHQLPQLVAVAVDGQPPRRHRSGVCGVTKGKQASGQQLARFQCHEAVPLAGAEHPLRRARFLEEVAAIKRHRGSQIFDGIVIVAVEPGVPPLREARLELGQVVKAGVGSETVRFALPADYGPRPGAGLGLDELAQSGDGNVEPVSRGTRPVVRPEGAAERVPVNKSSGLHGQIVQQGADPGPGEGAVDGAPGHSEGKCAETPHGPAPKSPRDSPGRDGPWPGPRDRGASQLLRSRGDHSGSIARQRGVDESHQPGQGDHSFELERHSRIAPVRVVPRRRFDQQGQGGGTRAPDGAGQLIAIGGPPGGVAHVGGEHPGLPPRPPTRPRLEHPTKLPPRRPNQTGGPPVGHRHWQSGNHPRVVRTRGRPRGF